MKQGEIWYIDLNPIQGSEQAGIRPAVILSGNLMNTHLNVIWIAPLTTKIKKYKGNPILTPNPANGLSSDSELLIFHLRSVSKERLIRKLGKITSGELKEALETVEDLIKL